MNRLAAMLVVLCAALLASCGEPLPKDKLAYAGEWRGEHVYLLITPGGRCEYTRRREAGNVKISAPIQRFEGDNFVVGVGPFSTTFVVTKPPRIDDGRWRMTVDGVELTRVGAFGELRTRGRPESTRPSPV
jgi:hypothetical protein